MIAHIPQTGNSSVRDALSDYLALTQRRHVEKSRMQADQRRRRTGRIPTPAELLQEGDELDVFEACHAVPCETARGKLISAMLIEHGLNPRAEVFPPIASLVDGRLVVVAIGELCQGIELIVLNFDEILGTRPGPSRPSAPGRSVYTADQAVS